MRIYTLIGWKCFFSKSVEGHSPPNDNALLRVVPLLFSGDMIVHSEISLVTHSGYKGSRRCYVTALPTTADLANTGKDIDFQLKVEMHKVIVSMRKI